MDKKELIPYNEIIEETVNELKKLQLSVPVQIISIDQLKEAISTVINNLIADDFSRLISLLYRLDISEKKLRKLLAISGNVSSSDIIAQMIIDRQQEKIKARKLFSTNNNFCDEEKW